DFEDYFAAKRRLFDMLKPGRRPAVNVDDPYGRRLAAEIPDALTFGERGEVSARGVAMSTEGIRGVLVTPRGEVPFASHLLGGYNLSNLLAAAALAETLELPQAAIAEAFAAQRPVPGRMELVDRGQPFAVFKIGRASCRERVSMAGVSLVLNKGTEVRVHFLLCVQ